jgi:hypothetical protein
VLTPARRLCDHDRSIKSAGVPRPQPEPYQGGNRSPMRTTGDAVPRRDKDGGMTRPERVFAFRPLNRIGGLSRGDIGEAENAGRVQLA